MLYFAAKRLMDLLLAAALLVPAALVCLPLALVIRLESPGSPLFRQTRVGRNRKPFTLYKLRTMGRDTGDLPSHLAGSMTITRIGGVLRRTKLDELPQLLNVVSGAMSFVGPRPCLRDQLDLIREREERGLFAYRPGITGPAQLAGIDMSAPRALADCEKDYYPKATLRSDLAIMARTVLGRGAGDAALGLGKTGDRS